MRARNLRSRTQSAVSCMQCMRIRNGLMQCYCSLCAGEVGGGGGTLIFRRACFIAASKLYFEAKVADTRTCSGGRGCGSREIVKAPLKVSGEFGPLHGGSHVVSARQRGCPQQGGSGTWVQHPRLSGPSEPVRYCDSDPERHPRRDCKPIQVPGARRQARIRQ